MKAGGEAAFQAHVVQLAAYYGWKHYHTHNSQRSVAGFPDLVLVRGPEIIFAELKTEKGRVKPEQAEWIAALACIEEGIRERFGLTASDPSPVETHLWRPSDFDYLHARLARGRHQTEPVYRSVA